jgi:large subunit ribosomal protein L32
MAVPKRKTSKSRRDRRRQQHGISIVAAVACARCHAPKLAHRVCPTCGTYRDRSYDAAATAG